MLFVNMVCLTVGLASGANLHPVHSGEGDVAEVLIGTVFFNRVRPVEAARMLLVNSMIRGTLNG
jgi:hypothetical protein